MTETPATGIPVARHFPETLPFRGRILVQRLESFGDIVVGFSISQLALQLGLPKSPHELVENPIRYVLFFATFSFIALAWMRYHRMLTTAFAPGRIDLVAAFAYLAFTGLFPYALYANSRISHDVDGARYGIAAYAICLIGTSGAAWLLNFRSLKRAIGVISEADIARLRQRTFIEGGIAVLLFIVLGLDFGVGPQWAGFTFLLLPFVARLARIRHPAHGWHHIHVYGKDDYGDI